MAARRTFLAGIVAAVAGCVGPGDSGRNADRNGEDGTTDTESDATEGGTDDGSSSDTDDEPSYPLRAAPVEGDDREPVLSTGDVAAAGIEPLVDLLSEVAETYRVAYTSLSPADAEAFEELTSGVERYHTGNPPGYYIDHEGFTISVSPSS